VVACFGVVLNAAYMLRAMQRVFFGAERPEHKGFAEIDAREITVLAPLAVMAILLGVVPTAMVFAFTDQTMAGWFGTFR
jgi:NADH-quinone oxidoreductase subunit M